MIDLQQARREVAAHIARNPHLLHIVRAIPRPLGLIVRMAFDCQPRERWQVYEQCKQMYDRAASQYNATLPAQQSSEALGGKHHESVCLLLDWLLPEQIGEEEE